MKLIVDFPTDSIKEQVIRCLNIDVKKLVREEMFSNGMLNELISVLKGKLEMEDFADYRKYKARMKGRENYLRRKQKLKDLPILKRE
jgi:hypothetical protein